MQGLLSQRGPAAGCRAKPKNLTFPYRIMTMDHSRQHNAAADQLQQLLSARTTQDASPPPTLSDEDTHALLALAFSTASSVADDDEQTRNALLEDAADVLARHPAAIHIYHEMLQTVTDLDAVPPTPFPRQTRRPVVASVCRSGASLNWVSKLPGRPLHKTELARDGKNTGELRFAERLSQCELEIQIATKGRSKFLVAVLFTFLNPVIPAQQLRLQLLLEDGSRLEAQPHNLLAEFLDVPPGTAELLILHQNPAGYTTELDGLALQLQLEA